jgi:hypothetical protein
MLEVLRQDTFGGSKGLPEGRLSINTPSDALMPVITVLGVAAGVMAAA